MSKYPFSQLIREIFLKLQGLRARQYVEHTPSEHNEVDFKNFLTSGDANLVNFFVAPQNRSLNYSFIVAPRNITQIHNLQLRKEGIWT